MNGVLVCAFMAIVLGTVALCAAIFFLPATWAFYAFWLAAFVIWLGFVAALWAAEALAVH